MLQYKQYGKVKKSTVQCQQYGKVLRVGYRTNSMVQYQQYHTVPTVWYSTKVWYSNKSMVQ